MYYKLLVLAFCFFATTTQAYEVTRVIDGDTVEIVADFLPDPLHKKLSVRIYTIDTPEKGFRSKCKEENELAQKASKFTSSLVLNPKNKIEVQLFEWDKYGGRVLGEILVNGIPLSILLINKGYAVNYNGGKKKSWCGEN
jgi:endonuclease YncB( thermonuclease family)